jgi:hypothetical protein
MWMSFCCSFAADTIPATDPLIEYTGRIDFTDPASPRFSYSGVSIRASFMGTSVGIIMDDNLGQNYYNVILDGRLFDTIRITTNKKIYIIADGLEDTSHEIELFKRTEEMFGKTQFFGFVVDEGANLIPLENGRDKLIEYIGNSITCGYGNEGVNGGTFGPTTENHYMTYAAFTSRNFNARHLAVCKSGIGIYRNYDGPAGGNTDCMTNYYTRVFLYDANPKYSFSDKPDLVCINLGTNDFSTTGGDSTLYVSNYFRLIDTIQTRYTMPDILCLLGPMMGDPTLGRVRNYLTFIADSASRKGKGNVYFFEMSQQTGSLGIAIDYHPTVAQHFKNGKELSGYIKLIKGWKINPLVIKASVNETNHIQLDLNTPVVDSVNSYGGFSVFMNDQECNIDSVCRDAINHDILHIWLEQPLGIGDKINLSYAPGNIYSEDSLMLGAINYQTVENTLKETLFSRGATTADGMKINLNSNKSLKKNSSIEGLIITRGSQEEISVDSFSILNTQLTLFLNNPVIKDDSVFAAYAGTDFYGIDGIPLSHFEKLVIKNNSSFTDLRVNEPFPSVIFPNPNHSGILYYQFDESLVQGGEASYELIGGNGTGILNGKITGTEGIIDLRGKVSEGVYFLKLVFSDSVITHPLMIK